MSDGRRELREPPVDPTLERIGEERIRNGLWAVWGCDGKVGEINGVVDLTRRDIGGGIGPIPVWGTEREGSRHPSIGVGLILLGDFKRSGLETLLQVEYLQYGISSAIVILTSYKAR